MSLSLGVGLVVAGWVGLCIGSAFQPVHGSSGNKKNGYGRVGKPKRRSDYRERTEGRVEMKNKGKIKNEKNN